MMEGNMINLMQPSVNGEMLVQLEKGIICKTHYKQVGRMCLAFECKNRSRLICDDCIADKNLHRNHQEQIVCLNQMKDQPKQVMEELKYRGVEKKELKKLVEKEFDQIMDEIWNIIQEGMREILIRGREAIKKLNEHIEAANNDDMDEIFNGISIDNDLLDKSNKNEIEKVLESLLEYKQIQNEEIFDMQVNQYLQEMYRKQKLSREIIIPDMQKDIRPRLQAMAQEMLLNCDKFLQNNIIENNNEIIRNEGISIQAPYKNETIREFDDLQLLIANNDQTINSLIIQRKFSLYENIEDAFHLIPPNITKIVYVLDADSRKFFQKIKYIPSSVKTIEISGTRSNFDSFKLPKSIQNLKLTLNQMTEINKVIDGFIRYTPQKLQTLEFCFTGCQISKKQVNHLIQSFKYLPNTLKTYIIHLQDNFLTPYSINKLILYTRYLPKSVHKVTIDVSSQFGNNSLNNDQYVQYGALNLLDTFPKQDIIKKLNQEKVDKADLYYGIEQSQLEYSFVRELLIDLSNNLFDEQYYFFCEIIFNVFTNLTKFSLMLNQCNIDNSKCEVIAKLLLKMPLSVKTVELFINKNIFDQYGLQTILEAIEIKKDQLSNFTLSFQNEKIQQEHINIIKNFIIQKQIHLEIIY
ncbi:hypothetical protein TTHERM_00860510 (macronuclear) [Tetrahymena thermophila SB210]|uniref:Uncharacterized protein n=1 Tax=Tetrahymena thermophila (strain SB210) TaxID=312017 RepID=Q23JT7_TETTS|nr:hypothetical protein TTHERM_00860510 [Tetrahymena thermophila SB210]EAR96773.2 hypothetical protein TTHERM_00860510 [Tetrahymena thermophila SB210]|eukprot:XP_001017018.2 hypothetical protein TTHERM_00860510 [Tetrahymena thermophila SB210]